jgi:hypothetical protein
MSDYSQQVNAIFANGPVIGANAATIFDTTWGASYNQDLVFDPNYWRQITDASPGNLSGVYTGSISALGNMVATALGNNYLIDKNRPLDYKYVDSNGNPATPISTTIDPTTGQQYSTYPVGTTVSPWLSGYFRTYWTNPQKTTFGANSAIPALTGVMPQQYQATMPGSFVYYVDLQMARLAGSNYWDNFYFINVLNQVVGWVLTSNIYTKGLLESEAKNLQYFGFKSYNDLITQGWAAYKGSEALIRSFKNIGKLVDTLALGIFGTSNGVTKTLIDNGLGAIGGLSTKLFESGIIYQQIENPNYTQQLNAILQSITAASDLAVIQSVLQTTVPTDLFTSPLSYTSIEATSGLTNDSGFVNLAEVGKDIYLKAPGSNFTLGIQVADLIIKIQTETSTSIEDLQTNNSLLTPEIIAQLRNYLPMSANNAPISVLNVIGTASGYYTEYLEKVNEGIAELTATDYGPQITSVLSEISRYFARVALSESENIAAANYTPVPPPQVQFNVEGVAVAIPGTGGPDWWQTQCIAKQSQYLALLNNIAADPAVKTIVDKINNNYNTVCQFLSIESTNYAKANISTSAFSDNSQIFSFVSSLPEYGVDRNQIGTDYLLYQLSQPTVSGNIAQNILNQYKNSDFISNAGGKITGLV